jgi:amino-acid N-acetyltransferase
MTVGRSVSEPEFVYSMASASDLDEVTSLLAQNGLPHTDVQHHIEHFVVVRCAAELVAVCGVELYGRDALLRSVCVAIRHRNQGLAGRACDLIEDYARNAGVRNLWLLTTTAEKFFARRNFEVRARDAAPASIQSTDEFRSLCPASAVCMSRRIAAG